jgi:antitoxin (DNA-binding transcriptional repressor) of toxin-antitoxin stability system
LQQNASELIERVARGERVEITRNGKLVAVISPPDPEQQVLEELVRTGLIDAAEISKSRGPWTVEPLAGDELTAGMTDALIGLRDAEDR